MRIVKKEFTVYTYSELNQDAKERAVEWICNSDFYTEVTCVTATEEAEYEVHNFLNDQDADVEIGWDTCSAGFIRTVDISVAGGSFDNQQLNKIVADTLQAVIDYDQSIEAIEHILNECEYEFTKNGKFYRD